MKNTFTLFLIFCFVPLLKAAAGIDCDYSKPELVDAMVEKTLLQEEILKGWECVFTSQNLKRDRNKTNNNWREHFPIERAREFEIEGFRLYYGFVPQKYKYTARLIPSENIIEIEVRVHMKLAKGLKKRIDICNEEETSNLYDKYWDRKVDRIKDNCHLNKRGLYYKPIPEIWKMIDQKIEQAEGAWNEKAPAGVRIKFKRVKDKNLAHYSIKATARMGAKYNSFIWFNFNHSVFAHEFGHMMGLDEEYAVVTSNIFPYHEISKDLGRREYKKKEAHIRDLRCNTDSMMCAGDEIYEYHYNHILRRIPQHDS